MIKLNADGEMGKAWMLGQDGKAIPCTIHIYGMLGDLDMNVEAGIWMMKYHPEDKIKAFLQDYVGFKAVNFAKPSDDPEEFKENIRNSLLAVGGNPGKPVGMSKEETADYLMSLAEEVPMDELLERGKQVKRRSGDFVARDLNEAFIRVRSGNEYNAADYNGVFYFRIGSTYKNWTDVIWKYVYDHPRIKTIVVERDMESDDVDVDTAKRNVLINNMSREEFLSAERLPFLGSRYVSGMAKAAYKILQTGVFSDLDSLPINSERLIALTAALKRDNIEQNYTEIDAPWADVPRNR